ncbi:alpha/beta fold hydrolase [Bradyrhizobium sp. AZCC 2230]|uniref:alpha/beta fold hydrolase n=1 Tax=Bradyrhizobium sp. AZCC 2230 TaxID=3117021 RepID=UPI002FF05389
MAGASDRRRVALVHSLALDGEFWRPVADILSNQAAVLMIDCRGHGASDKPSGPYSVEQFADDLADVLDGIGWPSAVIGGASMGGSVAIAFAARNAAKTAALGLFDTTAWYGANAPKQWEERAARGVADGMASLVEFQKTRWFGDAFRAQNADVIDRTVATFVKTDPKAYAETCRMMGAFDLRLKLGALRMPTRIAVGEQDYATPIKMAEELHAGIAGSELNIISGGRHLTPLEFPERIAAEIDLLLRKAVA